MAHGVIGHGVRTASGGTGDDPLLPSGPVPLPSLPAETAGNAPEENGHTTGRVVGHRMVRANRGTYHGALGPDRAVPLPRFSVRAATSRDSAKQNASPSTGVVRHSMLSAPR